MPTTTCSCGGDLFIDHTENGKIVVCVNGCSSS